MAAKKEETASFVLRFTQKVFQNDEGEPQVQWRGNIRHVQGGEEKRFSEFDEAVRFIQGKLTDLTLLAIEDKSPEEQKGILAKSFDLWKRMAVAGPKMVMETLKDPRAGVEHLQEQVNQVVQEQVREVGDLLSSKIDADNWRPATRSDVKNLMQAIADLTARVNTLTEKVDNKAQPRKKPKKS